MAGHIGPGASAEVVGASYSSGYIGQMEAAAVAVLGMGVERLRD